MVSKKNIDVLSDNRFINKMQKTQSTLTFSIGGSHYDVSKFICFCQTNYFNFIEVHLLSTYIICVKIVSHLIIIFLSYFF